MTETTNETTDSETVSETTGTEPKTGESTDSSEPDEDRADEHLQDIDAGCGCAEVWEALSEQREE